MIRYTNNQQAKKFGFNIELKRGLIPVLFSQQIPQEQIKQLKECLKFKKYIQKIDNAPEDVKIEKIQICTILLFSKNKIGYITLKVYGNKGKYKITDYVFMRGASVCILLFANQKLVVVEQYRVPKQQTCIQPPAGMIDEQGNLNSKAVDQLMQQTGIKIKTHMLQYMESFIPNPEICDEEMHLYYCRIELTEKRIRQIQQKIHGEVNSQQKIKVKFIQYDPIEILKTGNCAFIGLACAYEYKYKNKIEKKEVKKNNGWQ